MDKLLFLMLLLMALSVFFGSFRRYDLVLQFPFLVSCDILFFLSPQFYYISKNPDCYAGYSPGALSLFLLICFLFYVSAVLGYNNQSIRFRLPHLQFNPTIIIVGLYLLSAVALYGRVKLNALSDELTKATQWSGLPVRYLFFASVGQLCLPLGIVLFFLYRRKAILVPLMSEMGSMLSFIVLSGRRSAAAFVGLMVLTGLWFGSRYKIPRGLLIFGGLSFFLFVMNVGTYRQLVKSEDKDKWRQIKSEVFNVKKTLEKFTADDAPEGTGHLDALNGVLVSSAVFESFRYDYGKVAWNFVIHRWIPGQLVGHGLKNALKFDATGPDQVAAEVYSFTRSRGTCIPGYAEVFSSFSFLGVFMMYFMGRMARMVWEQAITGNLIAQMVHFSLVPIYLRFGGGGLWGLLSGLFFWVVFLVPILWLARKMYHGEPPMEFQEVPYEPNYGDEL